MENVLTRVELREELAPINEKLDDLAKSHSVHRERMARLEGRIDSLERHPEMCPARMQIGDLKSRANMTEEKVNALQIGLARMIGYMTGAGVVGGAATGLIFKMLGL